MRSEWNKLPYWLKWGLTILIVEALFIASIFIEGLKEGSAFDWFRITLLLPFAFPAFWFGDGLLVGISQQLALYFAVGSTFGWIFGKLKK